MPYARRWDSSPTRSTPGIMAYAQDHADYIAETQRSSHDQRDGSGPDDAGLHENVAGGDAGYITPYVAVNEIWSDWGHRHILVDYPSGTIGAGIALAADGQVHYVVNIREAGGAFTWITPTGGAAVGATPGERIDFPTFPAIHHQHSLRRWGPDPHGVGGAGAVEHRHLVRRDRG